MALFARCLPVRKYQSKGGGSMDIENMFSDIRIKTKGGKTEVDFEFLGDGRYMAFILALVIKNLEVHK